MDFLGENVTNVEEASQTVETYTELLHVIDRNRLNSNVSLKLTQLGLDLSGNICRTNLVRILETAADLGQFVRIDMESSHYTDSTLQMFYGLNEYHKHLGVVIQSYLFRSDEDIQKLIDCKARVRLVKGAYKEPSTISYASKRDVDNKYVSEMKSLLQYGNYPGIATHDKTIIEEAKRFSKERAISADRFEFQMLYGIERSLQRKLVNDGYRMRVYVPFGEQWYPYMMRRMAERPANLFFVIKNLLRH